MNKVEKIKAEIERRKDEFITQANSFESLGMTEKVTYFSALASNMAALIRYIDSLEQPIKRTPADIEAAMQEVEETESIWHDANQQPTMYRKYLVRYSDGRVSGSWERHDNGFIPWEDVVKEHGFTHWCYVEDLVKL